MNESINQSIDQSLKVSRCFIRDTEIKKKTNITIPSRRLKPLDQNCIGLRLPSWLFTKREGVDYGTTECKPK